MFQKILFLSTFTFFLNFNAQSKADQILGDWIASDHSVAVKVYKNNNQYQAKVVWFDEKLGSGKPMESRYDNENPNPELRTRKIIGMQILSGLQYNSENKSWENGKIYDASSGRTWDSVLHMAENGTLKVRGYWKFKWIGKTMSFKPLKNK